jgi:predicted DNA-binding transcriptional regulator YafY
LLREVWGVFVAYDSVALTDVDVQFSPRWREFAKTHRWHPSQQNLGSGTGRVRFHLRPCPEFEMWILGLGSDVKVLAPQWLRERIEGRLVTAAAQYGDTRSREQRTTSGRTRVRSRSLNGGRRTRRRG